MYAFSALADLVSAIVYLNDASGNFVFFTDESGKFYGPAGMSRIKEWPPTQGMLMMFTSGPENAHGVMHIQVL